MQGLWGVDDPLWLRLSRKVKQSYLVSDDWHTTLHALCLQDMPLADLKIAPLHLQWRLPILGWDFSTWGILLLIFVGIPCWTLVMGAYWAGRL